MPIPLIFGAIAIGTALFGGAKATEGIANMSEAEEIGKHAQECHEIAVNQIKADWEATNEFAAEYGEFQVYIIKDTIGRFIDFIERIGQRNKESDKKFLEGLDGISVQQVKEYKAAVMKTEQFFTGGTKAAGAALAGYGGAMGIASTVGAASTGTLIGGLSGAAATNATLAWLGGGSLAAGGGGMALGTAILGGVTLGPAMFIGGFMLAGEGEKALTKAREYEAQANVAIANMEAASEFMEQVQQRICELAKLLESLNDLAIMGLDELESLSSFDKKRDAGRFQQVACLIIALNEIMNVSVLDNQGKLNPVTATIQAKYRSIRAR
jgi:hypothetical protein